MTRGIVTAGDARFFKGIEILVRSVGDVPVSIIDLGLTEQQRLRLSPCELIEPKNLAMPRDVHAWQTWNKPLWIRACPYDTALWIDSDCIVNGDLGPIFDHIEEHGSLVTCHSWYEKLGGGNKDQLYELEPVALRFPAHMNVNAGVVGMKRGHPAACVVMDHWEYLVRRAAVDHHLRDLVGWFDEGCLHWALQKIGDPTLWVDRPDWNRIMNHIRTNDEVEFWRRYKQESTGNLINHIGGSPKYWEEWMIDWQKHAKHWGDRPHWNTDIRHLNWMYRVLTNRRWLNTLEIGCFNGASSIVFAHAKRQGLIENAHFCDIKVTDRFREAVDGIDPIIHEMTSLECLASGIDPDFIFLDGDHGPETVRKEAERILELSPAVIFAHDTSAQIGGHPGCEGPMFLKNAFQYAPGWFCLEDNQLRSSEKTYRGMFFATTDINLYRFAKVALWQSDQDAIRVNRNGVPL